MSQTTMVNSEAFEIFQIFESLRSPADLIGRVRRRSSKKRRRRRGSARPDVDSAVPTFEPLKREPELVHHFNLAMCYLAENATRLNRSTSPGSEVLNLIIDSGASVSLTPHESDFVGPIRPIHHTTLLGIAGGCDIEGAGTVQYRIPMSDNEDDFILTIRDVLYVPACPSRLLCPRQIHSQSSITGPTHASFVTDSEGATLIHEGVALRFPYDARTKLPILQAYNVDSPPRIASPV